MRTLIFHNSFLPDYSGSSIRLYNLLSRLPYLTTVITLNTQFDKGKIKKNEKIQNINVKRVSLESESFLNKYEPFRYFYRKDRIIKSAEFERFDVIQSRTMTLYMDAAKKLSEKSGKPLILEYHPYEKFSLMTDSYNYYLTKIAKILNYCDHVITLTESLKNHASIKYGIDRNKISVIKNGVECDRFMPKKEYKTKAEDLKAKLNVSGKIIMYAGYMDKINGICDLTEIIPSIIKNNNDISFIFIGNGPYANEIIEISKKYPQVNYLSSVPYDDMPVYYQMCDLFVIPRPSTLPAELITPLKLLEVMAMEKTVLGSDVGGIKEVIKHGENGYLFEKGNMDDFKEKLFTIINFNNTKVCKKARKTIINSYMWDKSSSNLQKVYDNLV